MLINNGVQIPQHGLERSDARTSCLSIQAFNFVGLLPSLHRFDEQAICVLVFVRQRGRSGHEKEGEQRHPMHNHGTLLCSKHRDKRSYLLDRGNWRKTISGHRHPMQDLKH